MFVFYIYFYFYGVTEINFSCAIYRGLDINLGTDVCSREHNHLAQMTWHRGLEKRLGHNLGKEAWHINLSHKPWVRISGKKLGTEAWVRGLGKRLG